MKLSIILPAYNEELRLPETLRDYASFFGDRFGDDVELIVVANHCSDNTVGVANEIAADYSFVSVIEESTRIGKGGAVELGMRRAKGDLVGFVDADGATPPKSFFHLIENIGNAGCAIGSRWIKGAVVNPRQSLARRIASRILNKLFVQGLFGLNVRDSQCGAKLFRKDVLEEILPNATEPGWAFDIDLLCRVKRVGHEILELPVEWHHVPGNATAFFLMGTQMLASVLRVKKSLRKSVDEKR